MKKIIIIGALPSSLINFRGELLKTFIAQGLEVIAMASGASPRDIKNVEGLGGRYIDYPVRRNGLNPINDIKTYFALKKIFKQENPDYIFAYTIKPVIWGSLAARTIKNTEFHALITGLGFAFQRGAFLKNILIKLISFLYKTALSTAITVTFQNNDNRQLFIENKLIHKNKAFLINGSGVDIQRFKYSELNLNQSKFLLIARLLKDKGIAEYIKAAKKIKLSYPDAIFELIGPEDPSPNAYPIKEIQKYHDLGIINYLGETQDVIPYLEGCQIYVLPSYHEGLPRTVIEAMAIGRPILTTFASGCKDTVIEGENGFLIPIKDSNALAMRLGWFLNNKNQWLKMGKKSREMAEKKYDVHVVNECILKIMGLKNENNI